MFPAIFLTFKHSLNNSGCSSWNLILCDPLTEIFNACDQFDSVPGVFRDELQHNQSPRTSSPGDSGLGFERAKEFRNDDW